MTMAIERWMDRADLLAGGLTERRIEAHCRSGELHRLRQGRYVSAASWSLGDPVDRHRIRAVEVGAAVAGRAVVSHQSAALLHGLELPPADLPRVHVTWPGSRGRRGTSNVHPHRGRLEEHDIVPLHGIGVTSVARTLFDLARSAPAEVSLSAADAGLRSGVASRAGLVELLDRTTRIRGHGRAVRVLAFADARSESVGESITRLRLAQLGLPDAELQVVLTGASFRATIRVDFEIVELATAVEFDGRLKYGRFLREGQSAGDAVFEEKRREDAIRGTGRQCVRVVWDELHVDRFRPTLLPRFAAAFARAGLPHWKPGPGRFMAD